LKDVLKPLLTIGSSLPTIILFPHLFPRVSDAGQPADVTSSLPLQPLPLYLQTSAPFQLT
jgi:hypothetical protein